MPESFTTSMGRVHNTKPVMDARSTDVRTIARYGGKIGIITGFNVALTSPTSKSVLVTKGVAVSPLGKEVVVGAAAGDSAQQARQALVLDYRTVDISALLGVSVYNALDPALYKIMLTLDTTKEMLKAYKVTTATAGEAETFAAAITGDENGNAVPEWDAATGDHGARGRATLSNPDTPNVTAVKVATEYILAFLTKSNALSSGVISAVTVKREKDSWANFGGLS